MTSPAVLFHYGPYQPLWRQPGLVQCGPQVTDQVDGFTVSEPDVRCIQRGLRQRQGDSRAVLLHYTDPFLMRAAPLGGLEHWCAPRLLICGDLHHGPEPIPTLARYLQRQPHHAVLLAFNPYLLKQVEAALTIPVHCYPPGFFRYPRRQRIADPQLRLVHVGSLGAHHPRRRQIVEALLSRGRIPFEHCTTATAEEAADVYASSALVLNVPLNFDLNHRFFEVMAAGSAQVVFASPRLLGDQQRWARRPDVFWVDDLDQLEQQVANLLIHRDWLKRPVEPPPQWPLSTLLRLCFAPVASVSAIR